MNKKKETDFSQTKLNTRLESKQKNTDEFFQSFTNGL
uniref:Uncharacterized protein n=1 Tax=viral metagenome TaxID=1070528 RepID=A0A6C0HIQ6_9ZZZZ